MRKQIIETCEMCSVEVTSPVTIKVEGALLNVCHKCSSFGNIVIKPGIKQSKRPVPSSTRRKPSPLRQTRSPRRIQRRENEVEKELVQGYGQEIKTARMKKKLTQEKLASMTGLTEPFIRSIEIEKIPPTDLAVRKLERELGIELFVSVESELDFDNKVQSKGTTLGDIAVIK
ncbi:MAG: TIGR00270 family protein, partial [Candidatus Heimdallarchaeota archaeon]|nr:TIGR00270 family protein [Candidatus Heimdallarchaeota archaeon]